VTNVLRNQWVLVVEDDDDSRELVVEILSDAGYAARGVSGAAAALDNLRVDRPCLVVADLIMDDMDGRELLAEARRLLDLAMPPFIFLTGAHPSKLDDISSVILTKPFDPDQLLGAIAHHSPPPERAD
jgi:DNA-binding response OmpR family regulator